MKNFLYTTGIFLLLLSPATCNYEDSSLLRTETEETLVGDLPTGDAIYTEEITTTVTTCEEGDPIIKPKKP